MTCFIQTQHLSSYCLLTPLLSPKDTKCKLIDNKAFTQYIMWIETRMMSAQDHTYYNQFTPAEKDCTSSANQLGCTDVSPALVFAYFRNA